MKIKIKSSEKTDKNRRKILSNLVKGSVGAAALSVAGSGSAACDQTEQRSALAPAGGKASRAAIKSKKQINYKIGCQHGGTGKKNLEYLARYGVFNIDGRSPKLIPGVGWDLEDSLKKREACEKYGISLDAYHLPLSSKGIDRVAVPNIFLGKSPERDREIEMIQQMIEVSSKTGVQTLMYNTTILPLLRTADKVDPERGNSRYLSWNWEEAQTSDQPLTIAGQVSVDDVFESITYFLDRVLPVAEEFNIRMANHIADPPIPAPYRGVMRWNSPDVFSGIRRFAGLYDSPSHGFNLCLGSVAEGLESPRTEILPIIKWVGERKQIFNIHLRNIKGGFNDFQEVYPDNGELDFGEILLALRDVDYDGMVMPDHVPPHEDPASELQGHAYAFGYIKALMHAIEMGYN